MLFRGAARQPEEAQMAYDTDGAHNTHDTHDPDRTDRLDDDLEHGLGNRYEDDAAEVIEAPVWSDGVRWRSGTDVRVSTLDALCGITPAMFGWWFAHMTAATYQDFHPHDHANFAWTRGKRPHEYVGATHRTHHRYGGTGPVMRSEITFVRPELMLPARALARLGAGHALAAVVRPLDEDDVPLPEVSGRFVHVALDRDYGSELRCHWWLTPGPDADPDRVTTGRVRHVHQEFGYLQGFLPALYAARQRPDVPGPTGSVPGHASPAPRQGSLG